MVLSSCAVERHLWGCGVIIKHGNGASKEMGRRIRKSSWLTSLLGVGLLMSSGLLSAGEDRFSVSSNGTVVFNLTNAMEMFTLEETGPAQYLSLIHI